MSLINDALKRASKSDQSRMREPETYAYVEAKAEPSRRPISPWRIIGLVVALGLGCFFAWQCWEGSRWAGIPNPEDAFVEEPVPAPVVAAAPKVVVQAPVPPPQIVAPASATNSAPPPPPKPVEPPWPAELKVLAIFYSQTNSRALINGQTLGVGDQIDGISIIEIGKDRVSVEWKGKSKVVYEE